MGLIVALIAVCSLIVIEILGTLLLPIILPCYKSLLTQIIDVISGPINGMTFAILLWEPPGLI